MSSTSLAPDIGLVAALYARKSTEQTGVAEDARSVTRQIEQGRAYILRKGWRVVTPTSTSTTGSRAPSSRSGPSSCG